MNEQELKQIKDRIREFNETHNTRGECLRSLRDAGIVNAQGELTTPYRSVVKRSKSK